MSPPVIAEIRVRAVDAPLDPPLRNSLNVIPRAPLVIVDMRTACGATGTAYAFPYTPAALARSLGAGLVGRTLAPATVRGGMALVPDGPGMGIVWNEAALAQHAADV